MKDAIRIVRNILIYGDLNQRRLEDIYDTLNESNRINVQVLSLICVLAMVGMLVSSYLVETLADLRLYYAGGALFGAAIFFLAKYPARGNHCLTLWLVYTLVCVLLLWGIMIGTVGSPEELSVTYIALMLTTPQMFTDRPWRFIAVIFSSVVLFICMVLRFKTPVTWITDISNAVSFGVLSSICCVYSMKNRVERFHLENTVRRMAETDQLTGLHNRLCYEQRLQEYIEDRKAENVFCIYVDVNGLHELNDREGHAAGDRMLQQVAMTMMHIFGDQDTFRIGGDEFMVVGVNRDVPELEDLICRMKTEIEAAGYHVAVGMNHCSGSGPDVKDLVRQAEQRMYQDKRTYYQQPGVDRRRR